MSFRWIIVLILFGLATLARADIIVIVNSKNKLSQLEKMQVMDLYMGRVSAFPNQRSAQIFDLQAGHPLRATFYQLLTGKSEAQIDAYWATLLFAGKVSPPKQMSREQDVIHIVRNNPASIAYVSKQHLPAGVKVVLEISENYAK